MRLATVRIDDRLAAARLDGDEYVLVPGVDSVDALLAQDEWREVAEAADGERIPAAGAELHQIVARPGKVLCIGLNYRNHILEMGRDLPEYPTVFAKFADTLTGPDDPVGIGPDDGLLDWEGELAVVVGRTAYRVDEAEAADHIAGYTVANDLSMRGRQYRSTEWLQGKAWARTTPLGPVLVTPDEIDLSSARIATTVDGVVKQEDTVADLLFTPAGLVAYLSEMVPLRPGDVILTGTPGGVGRARTPAEYLGVGSCVSVTVDGIGTVSTTVVANDAAPSPLERW